VVLIPFLLILFLAFVVLPIFVVWRWATAGSRKERAELHAEAVRTQVAQASSQLQALQQSILLKFDCRPCPRCSELTMAVL